MAGLLARFLRDSAALPFEWGKRDCALWAAQWIGLHVGYDPAAHLRGRYQTRLGCSRLLKREGGLLALSSRIADTIGLDVIEKPQPGDVACVRYGNTDLLCIAVSRGFAMKAPSGLIVDRGDLLRAWKIPA